MKDFRARLNEQKSEVNPDAWNQMSEMLDQLKPKRKRRWWFFIFFLCWSVQSLVYSEYDFGHQMLRILYYGAANLNLMI